MRRYAWTITTVIVFLALIFGSTIIRLYTDWLWFKDLDFSVVFSKRLITQIQLGLVFGLAFFLVVYANLWIARYIAPPPTVRVGFEEHLGERFGRIAKNALGPLLFLGSLVFAAMVGLEATTHWEDYLRFANPTSFGTADPQFNRDIGFYVFRLPFLRYIYGWLFFTFLAAAVASAVLHYADEKIDFILNKPQFAPKVKTHLAILVAALFFIKAWGYHLGKFSVLTNPSGLFYGAGFTDIHARLPALSILIGIAILGGILVLLNATRRGVGFATAALVILVGASFVLGSVYPNAVQQFSVKPNELNKESPYLKRAIEFTRKGYKLDNIDERQYEVSNTLTPEAVANNAATIQNVRLWDYRPLQAAYVQLQEIQQYYNFEDVDIDRYTINGRYRQVMLSARELNPDQLNQNAQTWVNRRLVYTHGYGFVMSPVSEVDPEGLPIMYVRDIPPQSSVDLQVRRPEIYFGEGAGDYVFVDTNAKEFDYPSGDEAVTTEYRGDGGVAIDSFFRRVAFALRFSDLNIILNSDVRPGSRVLFRRNIHERAKTLLPFLYFDSDPYLVVSSGRLYWFHDAYTIANSYPYSEPVDFGFDGFTQRLNYVRNSVKVITDAYTGDVRAYVADPDDPIVKTYSRIFPGILRPLSEMRPDMLSHIRYPEDLFAIQAEIYATYHQDDTEVFYSRGDQWTIPNVPRVTSAAAAADGGSDMRMEPYYLIMKLPGEEKEEMIILTPFTRANKNNMVAWLCAKNDPHDYGKLVLFEFPKGQLVYGPVQVASRISQDPQISQQLTLWNQQGSNVVRGHLIAIPIEGTLLYVEPLYLQAEGARIPELTRVIVAVGNKIAMEETLGEALSKVLGAPVPGIQPTAGAGAQPAARQPAASAPAAPTVPEAPTAQTSADVQQLIQQANDQFEEAERLQREGDWAGYGRKIEELKATLEKLQQESEAR